MSRFIPLLFLLVSFINVKAFNSDSLPKPSKNFSIGLSTQRGFIISHSESIRSVSYSNPWLIELDLSWHHTNKSAWNYCYCYPRTGLSVMYVNFDNPDILGQGFTIAPYVEPFLAASKRLNLSFRLAIGLAYLNNVYDEINNPTNLFYSTRLSFLLTAGVSLNYKINDHLNARLSGYYNHISNGGNREPNKGINYPTAGIGFDFRFKPVHFPSHDRSDYQQNGNESKSAWKAAFLFTAKTAVQEESQRYPLYGLTGSYSYRFGRLSAVIGGVEWVADHSLKERINRDIENASSHHRVAALAGHELQVGKFAFSQQLGVYLFSPARTKDPVYQRWGLEYKTNGNLYFGLNMKAHRHVADFMDARIGYYFR